MARSSCQARQCALLLVAVSVVACASEEDDPQTCTSELRQAIYGGHAEPGPSGPPLEQTYAIGGIESDGLLYCTGLVIDLHWVLSAAHCAAAPGLELRLTLPNRPDVLTPLGDPHVHPTRDLVLLQLLAHQQVAALGVEPLRLRTSPLEGDVVGKTAVLAGVGLTEDGKRGGLRFVAEPITAFDATSITVDGNGVTGACTGDSGGALFRNSSDGSAEVLGILSKGSSSCRGRDVYVRVDAEQAWLEQTMRLVQSSPRAHGACP